jgi:hypothetical protein
MCNQFLQDVIFRDVRPRSLTKYCPTLRRHFPDDSNIQNDGWFDLTIRDEGSPEY